MRSAVAVAVAATLATLAPSTASAHDDATGKSETEATATLRSTPFANTNYGQGVVSGMAELEEEDGRLKIEARVRGLKPGTAHIGHIHFGDCTRLFPGEIIFDLKPVKIGKDGEGRSVTVINDTAKASLAKVDNCRWWVAFHEASANSTPQSPAVAVGPVLLEKD